MPRVSESHRRQRRELILGAALSCFADRGLTGTSLEDIQQRSGVSIGGIYRYFSGKDEIVAACIALQQEMLTGLIESASLGDPDPMAFLGRLFGTLAAASEQATAGLPGGDGLAVVAWAEARQNSELGDSMAALHAELLARVTRTAEGWGERGLLRDGAEPTAVAEAVLSTLLGAIALSSIMRAPLSPGTPLALRALFPAG